MTILINGAQMTYRDTTQLISEQDSFVRQIVSAWHKSDTRHSFRDEESFKNAVRKNRKTLQSPDAIERLFRSSNYLFSTQSEGRAGTLYFKDSTATGRLRQQHPKGPLAKIDKRPKTHRFLSRKRYEWAKEWHDRHKDSLPSFYVYEIQAKNEKHHIEFAYDGKKVSDWHESAGTVRMSTRHLEIRIGCALKETLGIRHK